ncbi:unnamed protein product [Allacma fusca]|uniref:Uncharacterized protein n=1 Tax=Allacma fusca TaxID=39272 RepID=A0A8J2JRT1_9HEXA|nr:unnamed protein product [Allacma fusca]
MDYSPRQVFYIFLIGALSLLSNPTAGSGREISLNTSCNGRGGCSDNCKGDVDSHSEGNMDYCQTASLPRNDDPGSEIQERDAVYLTWYMRNCQCWECGGMREIECNDACHGLGHRHYRCRRCSCQCGRENFGEGAGGGNYQDHGGVRGS